MGAKAGVTLMGPHISPNTCVGGSYTTHGPPSGPTYFSSHTQAVTAFAELGNRPISGTSPALINLEIDQLARYVHRQLQFITPT